MTLTTSSLPEQVRSTFRAAVAAGQINLFGASSVLRVDDDPTSYPNQLVHVCPDLAAKPSVPLLTPDLSKVGKRDPLQGPEFGPGEKVLDFELDGMIYSIVHNLHALMEEHAMIIPHFERNPDKFRPQTSDLIESDIKAAWDVTSQYAEDGREIICFFNGGPLAGASQSHLHIQFCPFQDSTPPSPEIVARSLSFISSSEPTILPIPWIHYVIPIPPNPTSTQLFSLYRTLLRASRDYISTLDDSELPEDGPKRRSNNLFLTSRFMHLVPRRRRLVRFEKDTETGVKQEVWISVNGLVVLGLWHVGDENARKKLIEFGLENGLKECCYENKSYRAKDMRLQ